jgi:Kef-type K+ transport system membrane component KefB
MDRPRYHLVCGAVQELFWNLPGFRRISRIGRATIEAVVATTLAAAASLIVVFGWHLDPSPEAAGTLAQVGATILVAYGVEASWLLKSSHVRSRNREAGVGTASGIAFCGLIGIACAVALSSEGHNSQSVFQKLLLGWILASFLFLGVFVALVPNLVYDWTHQMDSPADDE